MNVIAFRFLGAAATLSLGLAGAGLYLAHVQTSPSAPEPMEQPSENLALGFPPSEVSEGDWLVVSGGPTPYENQISVAHDVVDLLRVLPRDGGQILFADGTHARSVFVADQDDRVSLRSRIGELLAAEYSTPGHFEEPSFEVNGPSSLNSLEMQLSVHWTSPSRTPFFFYVGGHGAGGDAPEDSVVALWNDEDLDVATLSVWLSQSIRPVRAVMTTCHAGGFARSFFWNEENPAQVPLDDRGVALACGLFATTYDRDASGCDPSPERREHESFGTHFLAALRNKNRDDAALPASRDLNSDGSISLLEAFVHSTIEARSLDVPFRTSWQYLQMQSTLEGELDEAYATPLEDFLVQALLQRLNLPSVEAAKERNQQLLARQEELEEEAMTARFEQEETEPLSFRARFRAQFPELTNPFREDFEQHLRAQRTKLQTFFQQMDAWSAAHPQGSAHEDEIESLILEEATLARLFLASEMRLRAKRLAKQHPDLVPFYEALIACENEVLFSRR